MIWRGSLAAAAVTFAEIPVLDPSLDQSFLGLYDGPAAALVRRFRVCAPRACPTSAATLFGCEDKGPNAARRRHEPLQAALAILEEYAAEACFSEASRRG